ncbi:hypothetical protein LguiB_020945 [Lonicera macranthoides]
MVVSCDQYIHNSIIDGYAKYGSVMDAHRNVTTWPYANWGSLETASKIFNKLGSRRNSITWNAMISVYTWVGDLTSTGSECCLIVCLKRMLSCGAQRFLVMHKMDNRHWLLSSSKKWSKPVT